MKYKQYDIWLADLNPAYGTETGKTRPVVLIQSDLLNDVHESTIVCPITTQIRIEAEVLRVHLSKNQLPFISDVLVDQVRAVDNKRLIKRLGRLQADQILRLKENLKLVLDL